ncbi:MAG TPA: threonine-phosphate decarboxylase [Candidatus Tenderia electrophaga]|uniref:threonine-phosphate decarboxylase n=1 Tax=Candidatus Tenderia electrophaga TaxID=1748243 RepID=A0A832N3Q2_9GAMM|nr:threonine-phosphate decarboxylase [Candidatus Tenderia electrophaga]
MLEHGGKLRLAAARYDIPLDQWLDLSTGINPNSWQGAMPPLSSWARLPEDEDGLRHAACSYYTAADLLPVAGSQAAIQTLPKLRSHCRVAVLAPSYNEHAHAWQCAGHVVDLIAAEQLDAAVESHDVVVVVNPNNPTAVCFDKQTLLRWHHQLAARGGWLIVDEAFMDVSPANSLAASANVNGLIVLRSLGKFFGLAGARVGFVLSDAALLQQLAQALGPWTISGPARWLATAALNDRAWQSETRQQLKQQGQRLKGLLSDHGLLPDGDTALFQSIATEQAAMIHEQLAGQGILTRLFIEPSRLRFGLPGNEAEWQRLATALAQLPRQKIQALSA